MTYTKASEWGGGYTANITVANATATQTGSAVTATNASYSGTVAAGSSASFGVQGTWASSDASPTAFSVNGVACS